MSKKIAVLTGAGISTSAGIPDFRGPDGVWTKHPEQTKVYDIDAFLTNQKDREYSWRWQKESPVWNAQPGTAHKALVKLEKAGLLTLLATQNFDALHEKAGNSPDIIVNLHGTIGTSHCMKCHAKYATADIMARLDEEPAIAVLSTRATCHATASSRLMSCISVKCCRMGRWRNRCGSSRRLTSSG